MPAAGTVRPVSSSSVAVAEGSRRSRSSRQMRTATSPAGCPTETCPVAGTTLPVALPISGARNSGLGFRVGRTDPVQAPRDAVPSVPDRGRGWNRGGCRRSGATAIAGKAQQGSGQRRTDAFQPTVLSQAPDPARLENSSGAACQRHRSVPACQGCSGADTVPGCGTSRVDQGSGNACI